MKNLIIPLICVLFLSGCDTPQSSSDDIQSKQQERLIAEGTAQTGIPSIKNFRERKLLKDIIEMRDQDGLVTYTYMQAEMTGKLVFLCDSIGYGIPAATQYTNPKKIAAVHHQGGYVTLPQSDPNGLFSPSSAEGTWVMCKDQNGDKARPIYVEPRIITSPFKLLNAQ